MFVAKCPACAERWMTLKFSIKNKETEPIEVPVSLGCKTSANRTGINLIYSIFKSLNH